MEEEILIEPNPPHLLLKEGCRILATTFLSLLLPLSFLLLSRLSTARYFFSVTTPNHDDPFPHFWLINPTFYVLALLSSLFTFAALLHSLTAGRVTIFSRRRRACILLFLFQVCLSLGIHGTVDAQISGYTVGRLVLPRRLAFALGLHETMGFWWRSTVKALVDEAILGYYSSKGLIFLEKVAMGAALANLWWHKLREEAEALVVLPWVVRELGLDLTAADVLGWLLYHVTAVIGLIGAVKRVARVMTWTFIR